MSELVQGLWVGPKLSTLERLSIQSFLANGHQYHLYTYDEIRNVPAGTIIKDATEILPPSRVFRYKHSGSFAGFSNFFRYKLLLERGGWWVDTDLVCLKRFDFTSPYVFSSERIGKRDIPTSGIMKTPAGADIMKYTWSVCDTAETDDLEWGETGPALVADAISRFSLENHLVSSQVFCPLAFREWESVLDPGVSLEFDDTTFAVHLWNEMWRKANRDKNAVYSSHCLFERLKSKYLS